jgi:hypothetical protein
MRSSIALIIALACIGALSPIFGQLPTGTTIYLKRSGIVLQTTTSEDSAAKPAGVAKDVAYDVIKTENGRLLIDANNNRQRGWISGHDAVTSYEAMTYFLAQLSRAPDDSYARLAHGAATLWLKHDREAALAEFNRAIEIDPNATLTA